MQQLQSDTALVVLSGGQDSTTCLFWAKEKFKHVHAVTFNYGQRHAAELASAWRIAKLAGVESHETVDLGAVLVGTSPLVSGNELEQYKDHHSLPGGLEKTFVPSRNTLFLTLASNRAYALRAATMITGICEEDNGGYPDCTESFRRSFEDTVNESFGFNQGIFGSERMRVLAPLMNLNKAATCNLAMSMGPASWHALAFSHTAYDGAYPPLGHDHATLLRAKGFEEAGLPDPLMLRAHAEGLCDLPDTPNYGETFRNNATYYDVARIAEMYKTLEVNKLV